MWQMAMLDKVLLDNTWKPACEAGIVVIEPLIGHQPVRRVGMDRAARAARTEGGGWRGLTAVVGRKFLATGGAGFSAGDAPRIPGCVVYRLGWDFGVEDSVTAA